MQRYALLGNPNTGKTTLFNRLCGLRAKTANFPGSTVSARVGSLRTNGHSVEIVDLPGHYGLNLDRPESRFCKAFLTGQIPSAPRPEAVLVVADATNLSRNLIFVSQALQQDLPAVVALNRIDLSQQRGLTIDVHKLSQRLGCPVVPVCARTGEGFDALKRALRAPVCSTAPLADPTSAQEAADWADELVSASVGGDHAVGAASDTLTDRLDVAFTHPLLGMLVFLAAMTGLFYSIFSLAQVPMDLIELLFVDLGGLAHAVLPAGPVRDLAVDGVVAGIAGTVVFLPQICLLFFLITLLEDCGYLARASFVMDRIMRRFGLPGQAFVPLLSAHACAIPAIMSARLIPDRRDRLATILVAPFMSCAARLPVYVLLIGMLLANKPLMAGLAFAGCYLLGALAAMLTALLVRSTILRGASRPMILELPEYKLPSIRIALVTTADRAWMFLRKAGTVIVAISVVLWWLGEYPHTPTPTSPVPGQTEVSTDPAQTAVQTEARTVREHKANTFIGRLGRFVEPVFEPLGYDWQLSVGVLSSFLAREVFVSTMVVVLTGSEDDPAENATVRQRIIEAKRSDGSPLFNTATSASLLIFYVLAMQCLPTLEVTRRETGSWRWAALQLVWMSAVAYLAALIVFNIVRLVETG